MVVVTIINKRMTSSKPTTNLKDILCVNTFRVVMLIDILNIFISMVGNDVDMKVDNDLLHNKMNKYGLFQS